MKQLLLILLREFSNPMLIDDEYDGLCSTIFVLQQNDLITYAQIDILTAIINRKLKSKFITYTDEDTWHIIGSRGDYLWKPFTKKPRIKWLNRLIKEYTNQYTGY